MTHTSFVSESALAEPSNRLISSATTTLGSILTIPPGGLSFISRLQIPVKPSIVVVRPPAELRGLKAEGYRVLPDMEPHERTEDGLAEAPKEPRADHAV